MNEIYIDDIIARARADRRDTMAMYRLLALFEGHVDEFIEFSRECDTSMPVEQRIQILISWLKPRL